MIVCESVVWLLERSPRGYMTFLIGWLYMIALALLHGLLRSILIIIQKKSLKKAQQDQEQPLSPNTQIRNRDCKDRLMFAARGSDTSTAPLTKQVWKGKYSADSSFFSAKKETVDTCGLWKSSKPASRFSLANLVGITLLAR